jgi:hypothetical protein
MTAPLLRRLVDRLDCWVARHEDYRPIGEGGYLFRMKVTTHRGPRLVLGDGTAINAGDRIGELHLDNNYTAALHGGGHPGLRFRREIARGLAALARDLRDRPDYQDIRAVRGATLFWRENGVAERSGFERRPLPAWTRWWLGTWERILLTAYHPEGRRRLAAGDVDVLGEVWITRRFLLARHEAAQARTRAREERRSSAAAPSTSPGASTDDPRGRAG